MADDRTEKYQNAKAKDEEQIQHEFSRGNKDEDLGVYCEMFSAKSSIEGQDGGIVTALLVQGFEEDIFDSAIVVQRKEGYTAEAVVAQNINEVTAAKGTEYLRVNVTQKLRELISQGKKRIAIVCTPCEVKALRKIQQTFKSDCEITIIGLFCFEAFNSVRLKKEIMTRLGVDLDKAQKTQIRQGKFTALVDGKEYSCKVKDLDQATEKACRYCNDFTSQLADISVGSVGSTKGYSTVIIRSKAGEKLSKNLEPAKETVDREEIARLSKLKRERAKKTLAALNNPK
jgi:coenzyme F420-reducing hydrogenase beta subunit